MAYNCLQLSILKYACPIYSFDKLKEYTEKWESNNFVDTVTKNVW